MALRGRKPKAIPKEELPLPVALPASPSSPPVVSLPEPDSGSAPQFTSLKDAQIHRHQIDVALKMVQYRKVTGELIETDLVRHMAGEISRNQREALYSFIDSSSPELAALTDPKLVRAYLREKMPLLFDSLEELWLSKISAEA